MHFFVIPVDRENMYSVSGQKKSILYIQATQNQENKRLSFLKVCLVNKIHLFSFVETPRKSISITAITTFTWCFHKTKQGNIRLHQLTTIEAYSKMKIIRCPNHQSSYNQDPLKYQNTLLYTMRLGLVFA